MSKDTYIFHLERAARKTGGDRYAYGESSDADYMVFYVPQSISRQNLEPADRLEITIRRLK